MGSTILVSYVIRLILARRLVWDVSTSLGIVANYSYERLIVVVVVVVENNVLVVEENVVDNQVLEVISLFLGIGLVGLILSI